MAIQLRASSSFSSVSTSTRSYTHDVFLSFRGEETRYGFTGHLHSSLVEKGINTFIDDELTRGEEISQALLQAIEGSKLSLIVFSENYATSKWCLDELIHILECRKSKNQMVRPIFYKVDPSDVRHQRGTFGEALAEHERKFKDDKDKVSRWRAALTDAANLSGWHYSSGYESELIKAIVKDVSPKVKEPTYLAMPRCQVGVHCRVEDMLQMLDVEATGVRMVGIWGIGGIGKTTIAKAVYNAIAHKFDGSCFLANVREDSEQHGGLVNLQNTLLSCIVGQKELKITNVDEGVTLLSERLKHKRFLLVVDDVDDLDQLQNLAGETDWFGHGSRVIITTRDKHFLIAHGVCQIYEAGELKDDEARVLFCENARMNYSNMDINEKHAVKAVVEYAQGLPLALKVLGSHLRGTSIYQWQGLLDVCRRSHLPGIQKILRISYNSLGEQEKQIFLDIACFFKYKNKNYLIRILDACGYTNSASSTEFLEKKALITTDYKHRICMHDLLEEMGKQIVHEESPKEPGRRSRLWYHSDVLQVLTENTGTSNIEGIIVKMPTSEEIHLNPKCFKTMERLKIFINVNGRFVGKVKYYPTQLRLLDWPECPLQFLPSNLDMKKMVELNLPGSHISRFGKGFKSMPNLTSLNLNGNRCLTHIPDLSGCPNLEHLVSRNCTSLLEVHPSVGSLEKLIELDLFYCVNLVKLPEKVNWRSLRHISLSFCRRLERFPEIVGEMKYITKLSLWDTGIKALPSSIRYLINLETLSLYRCGNLTVLPGSINTLQKLHAFKLTDCPKLEVVPTCSKVSDDEHDSSALEVCSSLDPGNLAPPRLLRSFTVGKCKSSDIDIMASLGCASTLESLDLSRNPIVILSEGIKEFVNLRRLDLSYCPRLVEIPELPPGVEELDVRGCVSLERISLLSNIAERKESQMIKQMNLTDCWTLCRNLVDTVEDDEVHADLFSLLLSSQLCYFTIKFPVPRSEIPKWFSCQMDNKGGHARRFEFWIEALPNFKWDNTGLAFCQLVKLDPPSLKVYIHINEVCVWGPLTNDLYAEEWGNHAWVQYVPFLEMWRLGYTRPLPPFTCRVTIHPYYFRCNVPLISYGVHLVMPPNEDVCMKLIRAEYLPGKLSDDDSPKRRGHEWDNYKSEQRTDCKQLYTDALLENQNL